MAAPLAVGGNRIWAWSPLLIATSLLCFIFIIKYPRQRWQAVPFPGWLLIIFALLSGWIILQTTLPFSSAFIASTSAALGEPIPGHMHWMPLEAWPQLARYLLYGLTFWLAWQWGHHRKHLYALIKAVTIAGTAYVALAILDINYPWPTPEADPQDISGPFINGNTFAPYLGLVLVCNLSWLLHSWQHQISSSRPKHVLRRLNPTVAALILMLLLNWTALFLTGSRLGISTVILCFSFLLLLSAQKYKKLAALILGIFLLIASTIGTAVLHRFPTLVTDWQQRQIIYQATWDGITDHPLTGTGLGSFRDVYFTYRPDVLEGVHSWWAHGGVYHAHSTHLENMLELGIPAFVLLASVFIWMGWMFSRHLHTTAGKRGLILLMLPLIHTSMSMTLEAPGLVMVWLSLLATHLAYCRRHHQRRHIPHYKVLPLVLTCLSSGLYFWYNPQIYNKKNTVEYIKNRPHNPYLWTTLAEQALQNQNWRALPKRTTLAIQTGPGVPHLAIRRLRLGLQSWLLLTDAGKDLIARQTRIALFYQPAQTKALLQATSPLVQQQLLQRLPPEIVQAILSPNEKNKPKP